MRKGWINTDVFLFSAEEMTYRAFVFTWGISSKLHVWRCGHARHTPSEPRELWGSIPSMGRPWYKTPAATSGGPVPPARSHHPPSTPSPHVCGSVHSGAHADLPTAATNAVEFAKRATSAAFFKHQQNQLLALPAAVAGEKGKTKQLFKEELGIASPHKVPFLSSRRKFHLAKSDYDHAMPPALHQP